MSDASATLEVSGSAVASRDRILLCAPFAGGDFDVLRERCANAGISNLVLAVPGDGPGEIRGVDTVRLDLPHPDGSLLPWFTRADALRAVADAAEKSDAKHCVLVSGDLHDLEDQDLRAIAQALGQHECDVVTPVYAMRATDGLLNSAVIYPLIRALYGRRIRFPLASLACASTPLLRQAGAVPASRQSSPVLLAVEAVAQNKTVCQVRLGVAAQPVAAGHGPEEILTNILGPVFADMEWKAPLWQRVRSSEEPLTLGQLRSVPQADEPPTDVHRMVEQFQLASRNLADVWSLVMPPTSQFALKRLGGSGESSLHMPEALWARVVYDFALAHRTRVISRSHLFGAFTPIYLAWVASFLNGPAGNAEARIELQARAFEQEKPYLLQRWRWPDRFTP